MSATLTARTDQINYDDVNGTGTFVVLILNADSEVIDGWLSRAISEDADEFAALLAREVVAAGWTMTGEVTNDGADIAVPVERA